MVKLENGLEESRDRNAKSISVIGPHMESVTVALTHFTLYTTTNFGLGNGTAAASIAALNISA